MRDDTLRIMTALLLHAFGWGLCCSAAPGSVSEGCCFLPKRLTAVAHGIINRVAYSPILKLKWFIDSAGMSKAVKRKMDDTVHMKYIDYFYRGTLLYGQSRRHISRKLWPTSLARRLPEAHSSTPQVDRNGPIMMMVYQT